MHTRKLEQLTDDELAVIEYFYNLSNPPADPLPLAERTVHGLSHFLMHVVGVAAHEPGMLSILAGDSIEDELVIYETEETLLRHVLELVMLKVLTDQEHSPETHPYTTPLLRPPIKPGDVPVYMPRITLYKHLCFIAFGGIEGIDAEISGILGDILVTQLQSAVRKHHRRTRGRRP